MLSSLGVLRGSKTFLATAAGYRALLAWARGTVRRAGVECTGSYATSPTKPPAAGGASPQGGAQSRFAWSEAVFEPRGRSDAMGWE